MPRALLITLVDELDPAAQFPNGVRWRDEERGASPPSLPRDDPTQSADYADFHQNKNAVPTVVGTAPNSLFEELADEATMIFVFDSREQFVAERLDCFRTIEGEMFVHLAAVEVTRHTFRLKDRFDLTLEINPRRCCSRS